MTPALYFMVVVLTLAGVMSTSAVRLNRHGLGVMVSYPRSIATFPPAQKLTRTLEDSPNRSNLEINGINPKQEKIRREILRWLSDVQYKAHHKRIVSRCLKGTGQWMFKRQEFHKWLGAEGSAALWLHGIRKMTSSYMNNPITA